MSKKPVLMIALVIASFAAMGYPAHRREEPEEPVHTPIAGGMIATGIALLILLPVLSMSLKEHQPGRSALRTSEGNSVRK